MKCSRLISIIAISICLVSSFVGCSEEAASSNNQNNISQNNTLAKSSTNEKSTSKDKSSISTDKSESKINDDAVHEQAQSKELINKIFENAKSGKIINSGFAAKTNSITDVEETLGPSRETDYVAEAKGSYANYPEQNVVFGFNKGTQIFETRSFDPSLKTISLSYLKSVLGKPDHTVTTKDEQIIGYVANSEYNLLFVFDHGSDESVLYLKHYSVLYPAGTVNTMADDPGRQW